MSDMLNNPLPPIASLQRLAISESGFVFDPATGHNFTVNETGLALLRLLQKQQDVQKIMTELSEQYEVSRRELERDVLEFTGVLRDYMGE